MKVLKTFGSIFAVIFAIVLFCVELLTHTYIVFCTVTEKSTINKITNSISVVDLFNDNNGKKNKLYYDVKKEFNLDDETLDSMIGSKLVNDCVSEIVNKIISESKNSSNYKISNEEFVNIVTDKVNSDEYNLNDNNKMKIIEFAKNNSSKIIDEIYNVGGSYYE